MYQIVSYNNMNVEHKLQYLIKLSQNNLFQILYVVLVPLFKNQ